MSEREPRDDVGSVPESPPSFTEAEALQSPLLIEAGFKHAFFTRRGGVSQPPRDTLSFSIAGGDDPACVLENRRRAARKLEVEERALYYLSQVHGTDAHVLSGDEPPEEVVRRVGDITLSRQPGVACGVRSADCVPVLLGDRLTGAVAAVHSGWKGTTMRAASIGVERLRDISGRSFELVAAIGPHISACCFEVGEDVADKLIVASSVGRAALSWGPPSSAARASSPTVTRTLRIDLRKIVRAQLIESGLSPENIDDVSGCTVCDPLRFHSYRRDGEMSGRLLSAIVSRVPQNAPR